MKKRLLLLAILLFPIVMLAYWVYWGLQHANNKQPNQPPAMQTNQSATPPVH